MLKCLRLLLFVVLGAMAHPPDGCTQRLNWAPLGATWWYQAAVNGFGPQEKQFILVVADSSTVRKGIACTRLKKSYTKYNASRQALDTVFFGYDYTYADSQRVYIYQYDTFVVLYDFGTQKNETWRFPAGVGSRSNCDSFGLARTDSVYTYKIQGQMLRGMDVTDLATNPNPNPNPNPWPNGPYWLLGTRIVERIGRLDGYFKATNQCLIDFDVDDAGGLRCYLDPVLGLYQHTSSACDYYRVLATDGLETSRLLLSPNPATAACSLSFPAEASFQLLDSRGSIVLEGRHYPPSSTLGLQTLAEGVYTLRLHSSQGVYTSMCVKLP